MKTVLVVAGSVQEFGDYIVDLSPGTHKSKMFFNGKATVGDTKYVFVNTAMAMFGYSDGADVVFIGDFKNLPEITEMEVLAATRYAQTH